MKDKISILVADDQELIRKALVTLLNSNQDFKVVKEAENGKEVIDFLKENEADIILLDVDMPVMNAKTTLEIIKNRFPNAKVIIQGVSQEHNLSAEFMLKGASNYLDRDCSVKALFRTVKVVHQEGYCFNEGMSREMVRYLKTRSEFEKEESFNERETEILTQICDGLTNKEIAQKLNLAVSTIDFHRTKIYRKAKCNSAASLLRFAIKKGIVSI